MRQELSERWVATACGKSAPRLSTVPTFPRIFDA